MSTEQQNSVVQDPLQNEFDAARYGAWFDPEDFSSFGGYPNGFEVKSERDWGYFRHQACGQIIKVALGWIGPRGVLQKLNYHLENCPTDKAGQPQGK